MLVGGASSRFGSDKASAHYQGRTMLDNALDVLSAAGLQHLTYVGGAPRDTTPRATHIPDIASLPDERCALRGVVSALHAVLPPLQQAVIIACVECGDESRDGFSAQQRQVASDNHRLL